MGTLGDRIGRRRLLLTGAVAFGAASMLAAFSFTAPMLIAARAILGVASATLAPSTLSLIRNMFLDPRERTVAVGVWIASISAGGALGPLLGGLFEPKQIEVTAGDDMAFAVCLFHWEGTSGRTLDFRLTTGLRRQGDEWVIVHEHHSVRTIEECFTGATRRQE
jgi:MFS family permease